MAAEFRVLGPVEVYSDGPAIDIGPARQRCVLAVLLHDANRWVPLDRLVERVWGGDELPMHPRSAAQMYVSTLRRALSPVSEAVIVRGQGGYRISVDESLVDVHAFLALLDRARGAGSGDQAVALYERALGLWSGEAFGDLDTPWLTGRRAALNGQRREAERDLTDLWLRNGMHGARLAQVAAWAREFPLDERLAGQLMLALFRSGRQGDALEHFRRVQRRLAEELGTDPGRALQELHQRILTDDASLADAATADGVPATALVVPRQLPAAPRWFTGRRAELDELLGQAARSGDDGHADSADGDGDNADADSGGAGIVVISAIDGMAGVGKTALAVHAAHRLADRFPDGQLFIDLRGHSREQQPRTSADALDRLLRALDVPPQRIPADTQERAALYRQRLAGTRTLIMLDNAADEAQIRPLLPGDAGCLVLVTSRRRLKGLDDAYALSLDVLPPADAVALLRRVATTPQEARDRAADPVLAEIAELCGRLPLALRIAAALLRHRPAWSPEHLATLLRDQRRRLSAFFDGERDLTAVFELSYQSLSTTHRRLFGRLALPPGPDIDAYAAAALTDTHPDVAGGLLEDLVDHNLLMQHTPGRYWMHDLLRLYARSLADHHVRADDPENALERLLDYYQYTATRAESLVTHYPGPASASDEPAHVPELPDPDSAWSWLRAERPNLLAALHYAAIESRPPRVLALTAGLATLLRADGPWSQAIELHTAAVATARDLGDRAHQAHALIQLGEMRGATGDYPGADRDLREALELCRALADHRGQAHALTLLGHRKALTGDYPGAERDLHEAVGLYRRLGDRGGQAHALTMLGQERGLTGDYPGAERDLLEALSLHRDLGDRRGQARCLIELAYVRQLTGDYPGATRDVDESLSLCRDLDDPRGRANALTLLGDIQQSTRDYPASARNLDEALELYGRLGDQLGQANVRTLRARTRGLTGDHQGAVSELREAVDLYRRIGAHGNMAWALNHYAAEVAATGDHVQALTHFQDALSLARETHQPDNEARALEGIGECHLHSGETQSGIVYLGQALSIFQKIAMAPDVRRVQERLARLPA